jgi:hypothetical protein
VISATIFLEGTGGKFGFRQLRHRAAPGSVASPRPEVDVHEKDTGRMRMCDAPGEQGMFSCKRMVAHVMVLRCLHPLAMVAVCGAKDEEEFTTDSRYTLQRSHLARGCCASAECTTGCITASGTTEKPF